MKEEQNLENIKKETERSSANNNLYKVWKDPVMSNIIANWIWYIIPTIAALIFSYIKKETILDWFLNMFLLEIKIYILIILVVVSIISRKIYFKYFRKKKNLDTYFLDKIIGHYKFGHLHNVLLTTYIELPNELRFKANADDLDLLTCFRVFTPTYSTGIGFNHPLSEGDFLYYQLGPKMLAFGLCEKVISDIDDNGTPNYYIQTSENGYKFFALLESYDRILNQKKYQEELEERNKQLDSE